MFEVFTVQKEIIVNNIFGVYARARINDYSLHLTALSIINQLKNIQIITIFNTIFCRIFTSAEKIIILIFQILYCN